MIEMMGMIQSTWWFVGLEHLLLSIVSLYFNGVLVKFIIMVK